MFELTTRLCLRIKSKHRESQNKLNSPQNHRFHALTLCIYITFKLHSTSLYMWISRLHVLNEMGSDEVEGGSWQPTNSYNHRAPRGDIKSL